MTGQTAQNGEGFSAFSLVLLAAVSVFWGINWPVMKVVVSEIPPLYFRAVALVVAGAALLAIARASGHNIRVPKNAWRNLALITLFNITAWNAFVIYGVSMIPSGRAALLGYTMPLWGSFLSVLFLGERMTRRRFVSLLSGIAGIAVLMGNVLLAARGAVAGTACMILAAWSWAIGIVLLKRLPIPVPTIVLTAWSMLLGGLPMLAAALPLETSRLVVPGFLPVMGVAYNIVFTFMLCYWAWNRIVFLLPVSVSSTSSLIVPLIGAVSGNVFLAEPLGWREAVAALLILSSVAGVIRR